MGGTNNNLQLVEHCSSYEQLRKPNQNSASRNKSTSRIRNEGSQNTTYMDSSKVQTHSACNKEHEGYFPHVTRSTKEPTSYSSRNKGSHSISTHNYKKMPETLTKGLGNKSTCKNCGVQNLTDVSSESLSQDYLIKSEAPHSPAGGSSIIILSLDLKKTGPVKDTGTKHHTFVQADQHVCEDADLIQRVVEGAVEGTMCMRDSTDVLQLDHEQPQNPNQKPAGRTKHAFRISCEGSQTTTHMDTSKGHRHCVYNKEHVDSVAHVTRSTKELQSNSSWNKDNHTLRTHHSKQRRETFINGFSSKSSCKNCTVQNPVNASSESLSPDSLVTFETPHSPAGSTFSNILSQNLKKEEHDTDTKHQPIVQADQQGSEHSDQHAGDEPMGETLCLKDSNNVLQSGDHCANHDQPRKPNQNSAGRKKHTYHVSDEGGQNTTHMDTCKGPGHSASNKKHEDSVACVTRSTKEPTSYSSRDKDNQTLRTHHSKYSRETSPNGLINKFTCKNCGVENPVDASGECLSQGSLVKSEAPHSEFLENPWGRRIHRRYLSGSQLLHFSDLLSMQLRPPSQQARKRWQKRLWRSVQSLRCSRPEIESDSEQPKSSPDVELNDSTEHLPQDSAGLNEQTRRSLIFRRMFRWRNQLDKKE
ncbi:uncharacterized protein [Ambystoma mexicanum]|uniref:uncharacterized protein n=1 Tax=Ambystoma mexicanum TaxID=8296 RepID=UPI0037E78D4E